MAGRDQTEENQIHGSVMHRVASLPLVQSAYQMLSLAYQDIRSLHPVVGCFCDLSERGVKTVSDVAAFGVSPLLRIMEPQISVVNSFALRLVNELEVRLPVLDQSADEVVSDFRDRLVDGVRDLNNRTLGGAQSLVRDTYEVMSLVVLSLRSPGVSELVRLGAERSVAWAEHIVDFYLPEEEDVGAQAGGQESSSSEETEEVAGAEAGLVSRLWLLVNAIITRGLKRVNSYADQFWELLHVGINILFSVPTQLMRLVDTAIGAIFFQNVSKEDPNQKANTKKSKMDSSFRRGPSPGKRRLLNSQPGGGVSIFESTTNNKQYFSEAEDRRDGARVVRRKSLDGFLNPSRIQED